MNEGNKIWVKAEVVLVFLALLVASVYSNNDMVERVAVPSLFVIFASISMLVRTIRNKNFADCSLGMLLLGFAASYFVMRGMTSPVQGLATSDLLLMLPAYLIAVIVSFKENRKVIASWLPWFIVVLVAVQSLPIATQLGDPTYVPFREPMLSKKFISGFFGHQNFFAALMGISGVVLLSYATFGRSSSGRSRKYRRGIWAVVALWPLVMLYMSSSRGAWVATAIALVVLFLLALVIRVLADKKNLKSSLLVGVIGICTALVVIFVGAEKMAESRSLGEQGFFFSNARTDLLVLAADCEPDNVLIGGGSRFYLYEARRVWDMDKVNWTLGDAQFVHNEYIETLVNYGYLGLLIFIGLIGGAFLLFAMQLIPGALSQRKKRGNGEWIAMQLSLLAMIIVIAVQCLVDFTLHILPLTLIAGLALGLLMRSKKPRAWAGILSLVFSSLAVVILSTKAIPLVASLPYVEKAKQCLRYGEPLDAARYYEKAAEKSGHFDHYSKTREIYDQLDATPEVRKKRSELGQICYELHPYDGVNLISLARVAQAAKKWDIGLKWAKEAEFWVGQSERKYGAKMLLAEIKLRVLQRDEKQAAEKGAQMTVKEFEDRLLECWQYYQESRVLKGKTNRWNSRVVNEIRAEYLLRSFFKHAILGEKLAYQNKMSEALAHITFARTLYKKVIKITKGAIDPNSLKKFELTTQQMAYFKRFKVTIDQDLLKQLEQEIVIR